LGADREIRKIAKYAEDYINGAVADVLAEMESSGDVNLDLQKKVVTTARAVKNIDSIETLRSLVEGGGNLAIRLDAAKCIRDITRHHYGEDIGKVNFEDVLGVTNDLWLNKKQTFPSDTKTLDRDSRAFARDLWRCRKPLTGQLDIDAGNEFSEKYFKIFNESAQLVNLEIRPTQRKFSMFLKDQITRNNPLGVKIYFLKPRRLGGSVDIARWCTINMLTRPHINSAVIAHKKSDREEKGALPYIWKLYNGFFTNLPYPPSRTNQLSGYSSGFEFHPDGLDVTTAFLSSGAKEVGRGGDNYHQLQVDEFAFYDPDDWERTRDALFNSFVDDPLNLLFILTTGNGRNHAHDMWLNAEKYGYANFFLGWHEVAAYRTIPPQGWKPSAVAEKYWTDRPWLNEYFWLHSGGAGGRQRFENAVRSRMYWFEQKLLGKHQGDLIAFMKEFPTTPNEAFSASGHSFLDPVTIAMCDRKRTPDRPAELVEPKWSGNISLAPDALNKKKLSVETDIILTQNSAGPLDIWEQPDPASYYVLGVDPCGEGNVRDPEMSDYAVISVFNQLTQEQDARYRALINPRDLFWPVAALALYYQGRDGAFIVPAVFNHGGMLIEELTNSSMAAMDKIGYWVYFQEQRDRRGKLIGNRYGFHESSTTRDKLYTNLQIFLSAMIHDPKRRVKDKGVIFEASFMQKVKGANKWDHPRQKGYHNDILTAWALAVIGMNSVQAQDRVPKVVRTESTETKKTGKRDGELAEDFRRAIEGYSPSSLEDRLWHTPLFGGTE
jgi:hypothetical protein